MKWLKHRAVQVVLVFGFFTAWAFFQSRFTSLYTEPGQLPLPGVFSVPYHFLICYYIWAVATLVILWIRPRILKLSFPRFVATHLMLGVVVSTLHSVLYYYSTWALLEHGKAKPFGGMSPGAFLLTEIRYNLWMYFTLVAFIHLFDYYKKSREKEVEAISLKAQLSQAQLQALKTQLQPHFLFNVLNTITSYVYAQPETAVQMIARLSDLLRTSLHEPLAPEIPLEKEVAFVQNYLDIEKIRFADRLNVELDIPPEVGAALVPALILQPIVENAIRHGAGRNMEEARIAIRASLQQNELHLTVSDNGPGFAPGASEGIGIRNSRERLERMYESRQQFRIDSRPSEGTTVHLVIPFRLQSPVAEGDQESQ